ncbi:MAG TPA: FAD-dependent monooxygenase [Vicinamibacterales bacterium]|jgi:salicylate hydroxylase|nr:FAD-dependent monooxygenase [Vicinamibacterales bacterium]
MGSLSERRIAVVGAGIGGLTLAIALRRLGISVDIYEQTAELREVGAAVALSANGTRFFEQFGLAPHLAEHWSEVAALIWRDGRSGRLVGKHSVGADYRQRFGAPYVGIHRADLQAVLSSAAGLERIHLRKRLVNIDDTAAGATLRFADGTTAEADLVVGADGARSFVRQWMLGYDDALYSGCSGFRGIVPMDRLPSLPDPTALQFWMGPGGHLLHYPMGNGHINFLLVERHPAPWPHRDWVMPGVEGEQLRHFAGWHPAVVEMITASPISNRWGLFHRPPLGRWTKGRVTLLGDAAHQLAPHHGQGANQSIEDAVVLAACLRDAASGPLDAPLERYERLRRGRTRKVQYASISAVDVLHLPDGDSADRRNARLASFDGALHHLGWIHEFDAASQEPTDRQGGTWL